MNLTNYERETMINFNEGEDTASVFTHNRPLRRRLEQLAQERPNECRLVKTSHDGEAVEYYVPKRWVKINPPREAAPLSEEQKQRRREHLAKLRNSSSNSGRADREQDHASAGMGKDTPQPTTGQNAAVDVAG